MRIGINKTYLCFGFLTAILSSTAVFADVQIKQLEEVMTVDSAIIKAYAHKSIKLSLTKQKVKISLTAIRPAPLSLSLFLSPFFSRILAILAIYLAISVSLSF